MTGTSAQYDHDDSENARQLARMAYANDHGQLTSEASIANYLRARELADQTVCLHCAVVVEVVPAAGARWVLDESHEPHCRKHDDNTLGVHHDAQLYPPAWE